jgi:chromosome partitioning protein
MKRPKAESRRRSGGWRLLHGRGHDQTVAEETAIADDEASDSAPETALDPVEPAAWRESQDSATPREPDDVAAAATNQAASVAYDAASATNAQPFPSAPDDLHVAVSEKDGAAETPFTSLAGPDDGQSEPNTDNESRDSDSRDFESRDSDSGDLDTRNLERKNSDTQRGVELDPAPAVPLDVAADTPFAREIADLTRRRAALAAERLPLPSATRVFTVANQKGGVGKTTTTVNLAAALARAGARVLVIDLDPQGNASTALGVDHRSETLSVYDVIIDDEPIAEVIQPSPEFDGLFCVPATIHLAGAEIELVSLVAREQRLRGSLQRFLEQTDEPFHYVFIDCPPSLGLLTINAFVAATEVLIPIQCEYYALEGLSQLLTNIALIEKHLNPTLSVSTILLTMFDSRTNLANQVAQDVRDHFPDQVLATPIPRSVRISEAPSYGQTVISYDTNSAGALSYREAAGEMARRGAPN